MALRQVAIPVLYGENSKPGFTSLYLTYIEMCFLLSLQFQMQTKLEIMNWCLVIYCDFRLLRLPFSRTALSQGRRILILVMVKNQIVKMIIVSAFHWKSFPEGTCWQWCVMGGRARCVRNGTAWDKKRTAPVHSGTVPFALVVRGENITGRPNRFYFFFIRRMVNELGLNS